MAGQRQPIELVVSKGKKHLTKAEIKERMETEVKPVTDGIEAPEYLNKRQREEFDKIAEQLQKLGIMGETDVDALAMFIISKGLYIKLTKQLCRNEVLSDSETTEQYMKNQDKAYRQCRQCAVDLGLTITSRCKLVIPKAREEPKENKFTRFRKDVG
ncbi:MAG: phage terminase small subunit P27 family [Oscillospiraceae bacterium]|nr:phage terminase small subunit P27 family [Oscillospiraceae bacterium]